MNNITIKDIHMAIKRGETIKYLVEKYGFKSEEELFESIRKMSLKGSKSLIADLKKNSKRKGSATAPNDVKASEMQPTDTNLDEADSIEEHEIGEEVITDEDRKETENEPFAGVSLETLKKQEEELSLKICKLESEHKQKSMQRRETMKQLAAVGHKCEELAEQVRNLRNEAERLKAEYDEGAQDMQNLNEEIGVSKELLSEVRTKIEELKKISIFVYKGGRIEIEGAEEPKISDEKISISFTQLISLKEAENFTIKELKAIAILVWIMEKFREEDLKTSVIFETEDMRILYENATPQQHN